MTIVRQNSVSDKPLFSVGVTLPQRIMFRTTFDAKAIATTKARYFFQTAVMTNYLIRAAVASVTNLALLVVCKVCIIVIQPRTIFPNFNYSTARASN